MREVRPERLCELGSCDGSDAGSPDAGCCKGVCITNFVVCGPRGGEVLLVDSVDQAIGCEHGACDVCTAASGLQGLPLSGTVLLGAFSGSHGAPETLQRNFRFAIRLDP